MNRRTAIKLATATLVTPTLLENQSPQGRMIPRTPDGDSWDNWAAGMADWEREALTGDFSKRFVMNWRNGVNGGWLLELGNYEQVPDVSNVWWNVIKWNDNVSLFWIVHPTYYALDDLQNAASWFRHVGVPVLGTGGTECGRVACCFLNEPKDEVLGVARAWRLSQWDPEEADCIPGPRAKGWPMAANFRVYYVRPPAGWQPTSASDVPPTFAAVSTEGSRCAMNVGIVQAERFNARAIKAGSFVESWAILIRDRHNDGKRGTP